MFRNIAARWSGVNLLSSLESEKNEKKRITKGIKLIKLKYHLLTLEKFFEMVADFYLVVLVIGVGRSHSVGRSRFVTTDRKTTARLLHYSAQCGNFGNFPPLQKFFVKLIYSITL